MGVQGLWELLAPVGRRVSVETLAGRKLAIDASIWMIQFMKAMRDEKGEMVRNAHLIGFFRRICKLLFLRTKPVFVFDGGTPALKRRTVIARRRQRENAQAKIRKTAEKLLLNHLKARKLEELARDIKNQKERNDLKGKKVVSDADDVTENAPGRNEELAGPNTQESIDEMLAASLAAEENEKFAGNTSSTVGGAPSDEEDGGDENEEMLLPLMSNNIDPTVLAALPPSMQLDLLVQMRERLMAENRHKFQKVKKAPTKFSELQIHSYLKTIAFRREIDEVQKSATGRGVGGVQTSRIASEANREFIFSSSFTGDKQTLTTAEVEKNRVLEHHTQAKQTIPSELLSCISSTSQFNSVTGESNNGLEKDSEHDVETYIDERGRVRVSRLRGLGFRMTRDLQRNLDLMKEFEQEKRKKSTVVGDDNDIHGATKVPENNHPMEVLSGDDGNVETNNIIEVDKKVAQSENGDLHQPSKAMEVSFLEDDFGPKSPDDDIFVRLVAGSSMSNFSSESVQHSCDSTPGFALDGRSSKGKNGSLDGDIEGSQPSLVDNNNSFEGEVDWEEGVCDVPGNASPLPIEEDITVSRGFLEEEADIHEAIRRSLEEFTTRQTVSSGKEDLDIADMEKTTVLSLEVPAFDYDVVDFSHIQPSNVRQGEASCKKVDGNQRFNNVYQGDTLQANDSLDKESATSGRIGVNAREGYEDSALRILNHEVNENGSICAAISYSDQITDLKPLEVPATGQVKCLGSSNEAEKGASATGGADGPIKIGSQNPEAETSDLDVILKNVHQSGSQAYHLNHFSDITNKNYGFYEGALKDQPIDKDKIACHDNLELQLEASQANLDEEMRLLREERLDLGDEQKKLERNAESVSSEMFAECQELLQMFGLPYIIAPMEAEAQCAYMELMNLVDGVVTDDSDVFLFGARGVYKNIFDDRKYVETYFMKDIETELGLSREKLIRMALLLGSDYTEGVSGIGIVNAIEVVNAFPEEDGLQKFREWLESPDPAILGKLAAHTGNSSRKKRSKVSSINHDDGSTNNMDGSASEESIFRNDDDQQAANGLTDIKQNFMDKHRNVSKNWHIPSSFPSESVISAYTSPQVDKSTEPFSWGKPDLFVLRKLCWERFGWNNQKADELLIPVLKEYDKHETQLRLEAFYTFNERFAKIRSKRIKKAVKGITGNRASELVEDRELECSESKEERTARPSETEADRSESPSNGMNDGISEVESRASGKIAPKQQRKRKTQSEMRRSTVQREGKPNVRRDCVNTRGRGRGRVGRGGRKEVHICESTETSSSDGDDGNNGIQIENTKGLSRVRTSARPRKQVNYAANDMNDDGISSSPNQSEGNCSDPLEQDPSSDQGVVGDACAPIDEKHESEPPLEMNSTTDYLFGGGGFCIDEDDNQNGNPTPQVLNPTRVSEDLFNAEKIDAPKAGWISIGTHALGNDDSPSISEHPRENMTSCSQVIEERVSLTEPAVSAGLSAMPALRRKRKKT